MNDKRTLANDLVPGSALHPGTLLREELDARTIKHVDFAKSLGIAKNVLSELVNGKRNFTPQLAIKLERLLGIDAEFWMKLQVTYEITRIRLRNRSTGSSVSSKKQPA